MHFLQRRQRHTIIRKPPFVPSITEESGKKARLTVRFKNAQMKPSCHAGESQLGEPRVARAKELIPNVWIKEHSHDEYIHVRVLGPSFLQTGVHTSSNLSVVFDVCEDTIEVGKGEKDLIDAGARTLHEICSNRERLKIGIKPKF